MLKHNLIAATAAALSLAAAPAALAHTTTAGSTAGDPTMNVCLVDFDCTYINFANGKPTDVIRRTGTITRWSINVGIYGSPEQVTLRVLRPQHGGAFKAIGASAPATIAGDDVNTFPTHIKVRKGDVLALENTTSSLLMATTGPGESIHYFDGIAPNGLLAPGATGAPDRVAPMLHVPIAATVRFSAPAR
jgi:hypothetical protein